MRRIPRKVLLAIVVSAVLYLIYQRLRIVIFVPLSPLQVLLAIVVLIGVSFLAVDHLFNRTRR